MKEHLETKYLDLKTWPHIRNILAPIVESSDQPDNPMVTTKNMTRNTVGEEVDD